MPSIARRPVPEIALPSAEATAAVAAKRTDYADQAVYGAPADSYRRSTAARTQLGQVGGGAKSFDDIAALLRVCHEFINRHLAL